MAKIVRIFMTELPTFGWRVREREDGRGAGGGGGQMTGHSRTNKTIGKARKSRLWPKYLPKFVES